MDFMILNINVHSIISHFVIYLIPLSVIILFLDKYNFYIFIIFLIPLSVIILLHLRDNSYIYNILKIPLFVIILF